MLLYVIVLLRTLPIVRSAIRLRKKCATQCKCTHENIGELIEGDVVIVYVMWEIVGRQSTDSTYILSYQVFNTNLDNLYIAAKFNYMGFICFHTSWLHIFSWTVIMFIYRSWQVWPLDKYGTPSINIRPIKIIIIKRLFTITGKVPKE